MNNAIQTNYETKTPTYFAKNIPPKPASPSKDFWNLLAQTSSRPATTASQKDLFPTTTANFDLARSIYAAKQQLQSQASRETPNISLASMLKAKYPHLVYHVFDASSSYWRTRNDYPHYLLYQSGEEAKETLENWQPSGPNPFCGSIDGKFIATKERQALVNVPPGSKAVVIHPKVQERMAQDPAYAQTIMAKIDAWFAFDVARNEAISPGSTIGLNQAVAIGEDGNICNAVSSGSGYSITYSSDEFVQAYHLRMAKRAEYMRYLAQKQMEDKILDAKEIASLTKAKANLAEMLDTQNLQAIFGDTIAGVPTETILSTPTQKFWACSSPS